MITAHIPKLLLKKFYFFSLQSIRMTGENINFDDKKIEKSDFYKNKKIFNIDDIDVNKILVSEKEPYSTKKALKYFIGCLRLSQVTGYTRKFDKNVTMSPMVNNF